MFVEHVWRQLLAWMFFVIIILPCVQGIVLCECNTLSQSRSPSLTELRGDEVLLSVMQVLLLQDGWLERLAIWTVELDAEGEWEACSSSVLILVKLKTGQVDSEHIIMTWVEWTILKLRKCLHYIICVHVCSSGTLEILQCPLGYRYLHLTTKDYECFLWIIA